MRYFSIKPANAPPGKRPFAWVDGDHQWILPNRIGCPGCTIYGAVGPPHPSVDLTGRAEADTLRQPTSASWRQFQALAEQLADLARPGVILRPGAELGPFTGVVRGGPVDFIAGPIHLLFTTPSAAARLSAAGIQLPAVVPAQLRGRSRAPTDFVEFDVPQAGRLAIESFTLREATPCGTCGRWERTLDHAVLEPGTAPADADLFRATNHVTVVLASE